MTSERQFGLFPECRDEIRSPLHGLEPVAGELADFANSGKAQVGDFMFLEIGPDGLDRIELRRVRRQARHGDLPVLFLQPCLDQARAMGGYPIPDDEQGLLDLAPERTQEFDDLLGADGAGKEAEVELPERQAGDRRELLPGEAVLQDRRLAAQTPGAGNARPLREPRFVYEDEGTALPPGFF